MLKNWWKKVFIAQQQKVISILKLMKNNWQNLFLEKIPEKYRVHILNILIIVMAYFISSLLMYKEFTFNCFLKEVFSILCIYGAIFCWFINKISENITMRVCLAVTACIAPVIFMDNSFGVALITLLLIVYIEFIIFSYLRGCKFFSNLIPVYIVCETAQDLKDIPVVFEKYKVLESIVLSSDKSNHKNIRISRISSIEGICHYLDKISLFHFLPMPKRILYYSRKPNVENISKLQKVVTKYSLQIFSINPLSEKEGKNLSLLPLDFQNLDKNVLLSSDKSSLNGMFRGKNVWICYDGRVAVRDLISMFSEISTANLSIICESEILVRDIQSRLKKSSRNYNIKIADLSFMLRNESRPDFLFYNMPIKSPFANENHLKEALVRNVLDTEKLIQLVYEFKIPYVYVLSTNKATNANNWVGATQRLGELLLQHADFYYRKNLSRFRVIRIPDNIQDDFNIKGDIIDSLKSSGNINIEISESELHKLFNAKEICSLLIKAILFAHKSNKNAEVFTIIPDKEANIDDFIKNICLNFGLKKDEEVKVVFQSHSETMELDEFPNISEPLTKTTAANIYSTNFVASAISSYNNSLPLEEVLKMSSREIISSVFQSLAEKTNQKNKQ